MIGPPCFAAACSAGLSRRRRSWRNQTTAPGLAPLVPPFFMHARYHSDMPSFDIVSELNPHEVVNAIDQANREVSTRFDFKGTNAKFELNEFVITLSAPADFQLKQMMDILKLKLTKRCIDIVCMKVDEP